MGGMCREGDALHRLIVVSLCHLFTRQTFLVVVAAAAAVRSRPPLRVTRAFSSAAFVRMIIIGWTIKIH